MSLARVTAAALVTALLVIMIATAASPSSADATRADPGCLSCHAGIEEMHPKHALTCVDCHGGNGTSTLKDTAHVKPSTTWPNDERVVPRDFDPAYVRFKNPSDLRVADQACGACHGDAVNHVLRSLHATTIGHLSDGLYENGDAAARLDSVAIFPTKDGHPEVPRGALKSVDGIPPYDAKHGARDLGAHFRDVPRKACMRCHLWSQGQAVEGRLGQDGDYRGAGCASCHVTYAKNGRSRSRDQAADHVRPGHPIAHQLTLQIPTDTCVHCHYGDASVGMHYRGLAQLVPGMPAGPDVRGTTAQLENGTYYIDDPMVTPPDIHHERGMHCIDCHTMNDVMGDGRIYAKMETAIEIECQDCHGTPSAVATLMTSRGTPMKNLVRRGEDVFLIGKVDGKEHRVKQAKHVVTPGHADFNARAQLAMTSDHAKLECYTCHAGWSVNFFGFHFDRNAAFTQLDLLSGERTPGRVSTQEKVFATFRQLYLGYNSEGMIAPYLVGFSSMGTVHGTKGETLIDQALPVTRAGLSGMTLVAHNLHSTRDVARPCADCHRSSVAYGLGSGRYSLARHLLAVTDDRGLEVMAYDRLSLDRGAPIAKLPLPGAARVVLATDEVTGVARTAFVIARGAGIFAVDLRRPEVPVRRDFVATTDPRDLLVAGQMLYVADGAGGVRVIDASDPADLLEVAVAPSQEARALALAWPYLYVADGKGGLVTLDVAHPQDGLPEVARLDLDRNKDTQDDARDVELVFQFSRINAAKHTRSMPRLLAIVANGVSGAAIVDATEPRDPTLLVPTQSLDGGLVFEAVQVDSMFDLGSPGGEVPTDENDYAYFLVRRGIRHELGVLRITNPRSIELITLENLQALYTDMKVVRSFNPPVLKHTLLFAGDAGIRQYDVTRGKKPELIGAAAYAGARSLAIEEFSFDRLVTEDGKPVKDISHPDARYLNAAEIERLLKVPLPRARERASVGRTGDQK